MIRCTTTGKFPLEAEHEAASEALPGLKLRRVLEMRPNMLDELGQAPLSASDRK